MTRTWANISAVWPPLTAHFPLMTMNGTPEMPFFLDSLIIVSTSSRSSSDSRKLTA